ncbi:hypothetical protein [Mangrovicoccus ximenensis]|uniref:hypothetical protein n=1 Tax=Mangrovicoccus ximenensis TaxID=1911570 RepID=UPI000D34488B|nr:hypothetical protein [Mangrovicoccus ximenensis]
MTLDSLHAAMAATTDPAGVWDVLCGYFRAQGAVWLQYQTVDLFRDPEEPLPGRLYWAGDASWEGARLDGGGGDPLAEQALGSGLPAFWAAPAEAGAARGRRGGTAVAGGFAHVRAAVGEGLRDGEGVTGPVGRVLTVRTTAG